jgi:UDP-N-acetyl-D-mannosaminuronic acid dehydrogenase
MKITVIGFGYIGSVISAVLSNKGHEVTAIDNNNNCIDELNRGVSHIPEPFLKEMIADSVKSKLLSGSVSYNNVAESNVILVTVGASLSIDYEADLSALQNVFKNLSTRVTNNQIIMIKSTIPPGVTRKLANDYFGLNNNIYIGFSPERLAEGNAIKEFQELPIIVGGINDISAQMCANFWKEALGVEVIKVASCETAELIKLANNQWIDLNIALANELAILCDALPYNIDILEVIKGANSLKKGQHFVNLLTPSIGVGGYCLTKDPWFVSTLGDKNERPLKLPRAGRLVNDNMPLYCANQIIRLLNKNNKKIENVKIAVLGYSFKSNSGDIRFSPMINFIDTLINKGCKEIKVFDSSIGLIELKHKGSVRVESWQECVKNVDVVVFGTAHDDIRLIPIANLVSLMNKNAIVFDGRRYFTKKEIYALKNLGINYLGVGRKFE